MEDSHEVGCEHCCSFAKYLLGRPDIGERHTRDSLCPACHNQLVVASVDGTWRCVECGIADAYIEGHVAQLWWSENPADGALNTGWGGSAIWACSCGARDEDDEDGTAGLAWATIHAGPSGSNVDVVR